MLIHQITATLDLKVWLPLIALLVSIIVNILTVIKMKSDNKEKMATKIYVDNKITLVDEKISVTDKKIEDHKGDNIREREELKEMIIQHHKSTGENLQLIVKLIESKTA